MESRSGNRRRYLAARHLSFSSALEPYRMQNPDGRLDSCPRRLFRTDVGRLFRPFKN